MPMTTILRRALAAIGIEPGAAWRGGSNLCVASLLYKDRSHTPLSPIPTYTYTPTPTHTPPPTPPSLCL